MSEKNWDFGKYFELHAIKVAALFLPSCIMFGKGTKNGYLTKFQNSNLIGEQNYRTKSSKTYLTFKNTLLRLSSDLLRGVISNYDKKFYIKQQFQQFTQNNKYIHIARWINRP